MMPVKLKAIQIRPGASSCAARWSSGREKLKMKRISSAKKNIEEMFSRLLSSLNPSFQTIRRMTLKKFIALQHFGDGHLGDAAPLHHPDPARHLRRHVAVMGGHQHRPAARDVFRDKGVDQRRAILVQGGIGLVEEEDVRS